MAQPQHILTAQSFDREFVDSVISDTRWIKSQLEGNQWKGDASTSSLPRLLEGKTMMLLFDQPSLRTYALFATAMRALGGNCEGWQNASRDSSLAKGETLEETGLILSMCPTVSVIVIRHPEALAALNASRQSAVPVINAGDKLEHPTQALKDLFTIEEELGQIDGIHITIVGDLQGRAVRSLLYALALYKDIRVTLVSPPELQLPQNVKVYAESRGVRITQEKTRLVDVEAVKTADVVYMMRPQIENWFLDMDPSVRSGWIRELSGKYFYNCAMNAKIMANLPTHARVLHPLPHNEELATDLNPVLDQRLAYFRQAYNGGPLGIALLARLHLGPSWRMERKKLS